MGEYLYTRVYDSTYGHYNTESVCTVFKTLLDSINDEIEGYLIRIEKNADYVIVYTTPALSIEDESRLDNVVSTYKLSYEDRILYKYKKLKVEEIKNNNIKLETAGFEFPPASGNKFDLQLYSRSTWQGMSIADFYKFLPYPQPIRTVEETIFYIDSSENMAAFFAYGLARQKYIFDSSAVLISQVENSETVEQVLAVVDNRV